MTRNSKIQKNILITFCHRFSDCDSNLKKIEFFIKNLNLGITFSLFEFEESKNCQNGRRQLNSECASRALQFDILYVFFRHRMQKLWPFYFFIKILCKIGQILCFLIFLTTRLLNIAKTQEIEILRK